MGVPEQRVKFEGFCPGESPEVEAERFYRTLDRRRSIRHFSTRPVSEEVIRWVVAAASTAPSGAHKQPWRFVAVRDTVVKRKLRLAAEAEEREFYARRANPEWLSDLAYLGTDASKPFIEDAPWVIVVFKLMKTDPDAQGRQGQVYYANESVGIACGFLLAAIHHAGLVTLTHTPSPMGFLSELLGRPDHERAFIVLPVGYAAEGCTVPNLERKPLSDVLVVV